MYSEVADIVFTEEMSCVGRNQGSGKAALGSVYMYIIALTEKVKLTSYQCFGAFNLCLCLDSRNKFQAHASKCT